MGKPIYEVERRFELPIGHRLSKHKGRCKSIHGHNILIYIRLSRLELNENDMVMDFSDLKKMGMNILDNWDHALILNKEDEKCFNGEVADRLITIETDPTAESLCEILYCGMKLQLEKYDPKLKLVEVRIFENENSQAIYREE